MIKFFLILALVTGGIFAFSVLEEVHKENPEILAQLDQAWREIINGEHNDLRPGGGSTGAGPVCVAASRPNTFGYAARSNLRPDFGGRRYSNNASTQNNNIRFNGNNNANDLAAAYKQWRDAVRKHQKAMQASGNGGQDPACRAALQKVWSTKHRYDTLKAQAYGR